MLLAKFIFRHTGDAAQPSEAPHPPFWYARRAIFWGGKTQSPPELILLAKFIFRHTGDAAQPSESGGENRDYKYTSEAMPEGL
jgi:hypothetical protein